VRQGNLFSRAKKSVAKRRHIYDEQNLASAALILEDAEKHGGEQSLPVVWARMILERTGSDQEPKSEGNSERAPLNCDS